MASDHPLFIVEYDMRALVLSFFGIAAVAGAALAQSPPTNQKIVVTFPAGGTADVLARLVADEMGKTSGASVIVDNRPGANSIIGNEFVARAAPDGGTMLMVANSFLITSFARKLPYDTMKSFAPVCSLADSPLIIVVRADSPFKTLGELIAATTARPASVALGAIGPATAQRVATEMLRKSAGLDVNFVPYPSSAQALNALLGGEIPTVMVAIADAAGMARDGRVRMLATLNATRVAGWPDLPTVRETGHDVAYSSWFGLVAPAGVPAPTLDALGDTIGKAMRAPDLVAKLKPLEFYPNVRCGAAFGDYLRAESEATGKIVREANIKMD